MKTSKRIAILALGSVVFAGYGTRLLGMERALEQAKEAREEQKAAAIKSRIVRGRRVYKQSQLDSQLKSWNEIINAQTSWDNIVEAYKNAFVWADEIRSPALKNRAKIAINRTFSRKMNQEFGDELERFQALGPRFGNLATEAEAADFQDLQQTQMLYNTEEELYQEITDKYEKLPLSDFKTTFIINDNAVRAPRSRAIRALHEKTDGYVDQFIATLRRLEQQFLATELTVARGTPAATEALTRSRRFLKPFVDYTRRDTKGIHTVNVEKLNQKLPKVQEFIKAKQEAAIAFQKLRRKVEEEPPLLLEEEVLIEERPPPVLEVPEVDEPLPGLEVIYPEVPEVEPKVQEVEEVGEVLRMIDTEDEDEEDIM